MKKFIFSFLISVMVLGFGFQVNAAEKISIIGGSATLYYSPTQGWAKQSNATDSIKIDKVSNNYYVNGGLAFTIKSDFDFISNNKFVAVDNSKLKFYNPVYKDDKFDVVEMTPSDVQSLFSTITVVPVSQFANGGVEVKRHINGTTVFLLVNDTNRDFTGYSFSPTSVQKTQLKGLFIVRRSLNVRFAIERMDRQNCLSMYVRRDENEYTNNTHDTEPAYGYGEFVIFEEI